MKYINQHFFNVEHINSDYNSELIFFNLKKYKYLYSLINFVPKPYFNINFNKIYKK